MTFGQTVIVPPINEPLTSAQVKTWLGIPEPIREFDSQLDVLIGAARGFFEADTNRQVVEATWRFTYSGFPRGRDALLIPRAPLQSVSQITYPDEAGGDVVFPATEYVVDGSRRPGRVELVPGSNWPATAAPVAVEAVCGYPDGQVPEALQHVLLMMVDEWFNNRQGDGRIGETTRALLNTFKVGDQWLTYGPAS